MLLEEIDYWRQYLEVSLKAYEPKTVDQIMSEWGRKINYGELLSKAQ